MHTWIATLKCSIHDGKPHISREIANVGDDGICNLWHPIGGWHDIGAGPVANWEAGAELLVLERGDLRELQSDARVCPSVICIGTGGFCVANCVGVSCA